jgi:translation initiation factor IF-2
MNNGKVRIYELSKELNLDNKELLAICDQLNIAVKSHSSTITESEAERIRSLAQKLATTNSTPRNESGASHKPNSPQAGSRNRPAAPHKQQILEIRKPKILKNSSSNAFEASVATNNQVASEVMSPTPPKSPAPAVSNMKPTAPTRPVPRNQSETTPVEPQAPVENKKAQSQSVEKPTTEKPVFPSKPKLAEKSPDKPPKPELVGPPQRPETEKSQPTAQLSPVEKPILKREQKQDAGRQEQQKQKVNKAPSVGGKEQGASSAVPKPVRPGTNRPEKGNTRPQQDRSSDAPQRPGRPVRPGTPVAPALNAPSKIGASKAGATVGTGTDEVDTGVDVLELKRPLPPRQSTKGKKWQEEEPVDELKDSKAKAAKGKRLKPILDDFDEDDDLLDEDELSPAEALVSNAIIRPPKQKNNNRPDIVSAPITSAPKPKKQGTNNREQNRRREVVEVKRERPPLLVITDTMTVQELADALVIADTEIVKILFMKGMAVSITQTLDFTTIKQVATELEVAVETAEPEAEAKKVIEMLSAHDLENLQRRPPVVTIMGHVDHGKTTLLDSIRKTKVAAGEAGGITQHIGAYHVDIEHDGKEQQIVFLDTPGHQAFTAMRARGARVTDIAVLVVAADDGVRPQTVEAISHAQAAGVPIVVAINKIDKEGAQPDRVKQELTQYSLTAEEWGGETIMVPVSAIRGENLDTLLEMILLVAEVEELSANPNRPAKGTVIEAHLDKAKGAVATLLIQNGTLRVGDMLVAGSAFGKVRAMVDDRGKRVEVASPSFAVEVLGLSEVPAAGDEFDVFEVEKEARSLASQRAEKQRQSRLMQGRVTLTALSAQAQEGELKELNLILKGDVQGSVEAIVGSLKQIPQNEVQIRLLLATAGEITQTDIDLAAASGAVIIGFNTTYASGARQAADEAGVDVREYNIIYKLLEDIEGALEGLLEPELVEEALGTVEIRAVFPVGRGAVAGCYIQSGKLLRNCKIRVRRGGKFIYEGALDSLKRMKEDVKEVNAGYECGVGVDKFNEWIEGDIIEAYQMVTKRRTLASTR